MSGSLSSDEQKMKGDEMTKDRRTKADLIDSLNLAVSRERQTMDANHKMERELRNVKEDNEAAGASVDNLKKTLETIRQSIATAVTLKHTKTLAFGGVEEVLYGGQVIHPGYEGDSEEVRLLKLLDDKCQEALG